jgi:AraC family transcriptional regulator
VQVRSGQFYGTTVRTTTFAGFVLADTAYGPGMRIGRHMHERSYISFLLRGSYTERYANQTRRCEPGAVLVHPAGESHTNQFDEDGGRVLSLEIPSGYCDPDPRCLATDDAAEVYQLANLMSRLGRELAFGDDSYITIEAVAFELAGILERAFAPAQHAPRWLREVVALLHERFCEPLSLQEIAAAIGVHPVHLARTFRAVRHCTVGDYLRYLRVAFARRKLAESSIPIVEIAHRSGFSDQSHLGRVFKRQTGMTPSQFRSVIE